MNGLGQRLVIAPIRFRYAVVAFWIVAAALSALSLPSPEEAETGSLGELVATDAEAIEAEVRAAEQFDFPVLSRTIVVQRNSQRLGADEIARSTRNLLALNRGVLEGSEEIAFGLGASNLLGEPPFSREKSTTYLTYLFFQPEVGPGERTRRAQDYAEQNLTREDGTYVGVTGAAPARAEQHEVIADALPLVELLTIALVCFVMGIHFRSLGAPLLNLGAIAITYLVASRSVASIGEAIGVVVPREVEPVLVALLFGIVTDYSIFFLSRFRDSIASGNESRVAALETSRELFPVIFIAGITVAGATATLAFARLGFFQAFGPGLGLSVLIALAVSTTLVPALLAIFGERVLWPSRPRPTSSGPGRVWSRLSGIRKRIRAAPASRPAVVALGSGLLLAALATGLFRLEVGNRTITGLPAGAEAAEAYEQASKGFAPGILSPTMILIEGEGIAERRESLVRLQRDIASRRHVATVLGPRQVRSPVDFGALYARSGDAARLLVILDADPFGNRAIRTVTRLSDDLPGLLAGARLTDAGGSIAGDTAISAETVEKSQEDLARVVPAAALIVFAILALFLRALVAPLYLVLTSLLALAASLGLTVYIFQDLLGYGELTFYVPFAATVLLVALGSDYNVYLAARIWREARRRPLREAVEVGGSGAAGAIAVAGLVLAASFAMIALVPLQAFRQLAFAVSFGLLIDAFVVRALLAPALIALVGPLSGWPGRGLRRRRASVATRKKDR